MKNKLPIFSVIALLILIVVGMVFVFSDFSVKGENSLLGEYSHGGRRSDNRNNLSDDVSSQSSNKRSVSNQSSGDSEFIVFDEDVVPEKSESSVNSENAISDETEKVLDVGNELALIEFTLLDGVSKKILPNLAVKVRAKYLGKWQDNLSLTTNEEGKINFKIKRRGYASFQILTNEYSYYDIFVVRDEGNSYVVELFKGGVLEVKINASDKKRTEGVVATLIIAPRLFEVEWLEVDDLRNFIQMSYDSTQDIYFLKNLPIGFNLASFKAPSYEDSGVYKFFMNSNGTTRVEVNLVPTRTLLFDLDVAEECEFIYISEIPSTLRDSYDERVKGMMYNFKKATEEFGLKYPKNLPNAMRQTLNSSVRYDVNMFKIPRNSQGLFEYELLLNGSPAVMLFTDIYAPKCVVLNYDNDRYKVSVSEDLGKRLIVKNEKGEPIANARVNYSWSQPLEPHEWVSSTRPPSYELTTKSDMNGVAFLMDGSEYYSVKVFHKDYEGTHSRWDVDKNGNTKIITMATAIEKIKPEPERISGRVLFQGKPIADAKVCLYKTVRYNLLDRMNSEGDGRYLLDGSISNKAHSEVYTLRAFHKDFGVATVENIDLSDGNKKIDLHLNEEVSIVRIVDINQMPLENMRVKLTTHLNQNFAVTYVTNKEAQIRLLNMKYPIYDIHSENNRYQFDSKIKITNDVIDLVAKPSDLRRINVSVSSGASFQGILTVGFSNEHFFKYLNTVTDENGFIYLDFSNMPFVEFLLFKSPDHAFVIEGHFNKFDDIPKEFYIELEEEEKFSITVLDKETKRPLQGVSVMINLWRINIQSLYTNDLGKATFTGSAGKFGVTLEKRGYKSYIKKEFGSHEPRDATIYLEKW